MHNNGVKLPMELMQTQPILMVLIHQPRPRLEVSISIYIEEKTIHDVSKSSMESMNNLFFLFLSFFIGMIDLLFSSSCSNVICTENNENDYVLSMSVFSLEDNDCFFCFIANYTKCRRYTQNLVCLINCYLCFVYFILFLFKIYLYNSLNDLFYDDFSHR